MLDREFWSVYFGVLFIFALSGSATALIGGALDFFGASGLWNAFEELFHNSGAISALLYFMGCFFVALAIYDGQFVGQVKKMHWSKKVDGRTPP